jgi:hypothetical protein
MMPEYYFFYVLLAEAKPSYDNLICVMGSVKDSWDETEIFMG